MALFSVRIAFHVGTLDLLTLVVDRRTDDDDARDARRLRAAARPEVRRDRVTHSRATRRRTSNERQRGAEKSLAPITCITPTSRLYLFSHARDVMTAVLFTLSPFDRRACSVPLR